MAPPANYRAGAAQRTTAANFVVTYSNNFPAAARTAFAPAAGPAELLVRNTLGQEARRQKLALAPGQPAVRVALGAVPAGLYHVSLRGAHGVMLTNKVQVQP